jgi:hypothetical protein
VRLIKLACAAIIWRSVFCQQITLNIQHFDLVVSCIGNQYTIRPIRREACWPIKVCGDSSNKAEAGAVETKHLKPVISAIGYNHIAATVYSQALRIVELARSATGTTV